MVKVFNGIMPEVGTTLTVSDNINIDMITKIYSIIDDNGVIKTERINNTDKSFDFYTYIKLDGTLIIHTGPTATNIAGKPFKITITY